MSEVPLSIFSATNREPRAGAAGLCSRLGGRVQNAPGGIIVLPGNTAEAGGGHAGTSRVGMAVESRAGRRLAGGRRDRLRVVHADLMGAPPTARGRHHREDEEAAAPLATSAPLSSPPSPLRSCRSCPPPRPSCESKAVLESMAAARPPLVLKSGSAPRTSLSALARFVFTLYLASLICLWARKAPRTHFSQEPGLRNSGGPGWAGRR